MGSAPLRLGSLRRHRVQGLPKGDSGDSQGVYSQAGAEGRIFRSL